MVNVLLIEPNITVRACMRRTLSILGARVQELDALPESLVAPQKESVEPPALVVIDCSRPSQRYWNSIIKLLDDAEGQVPVLPVSVRPQTLPTHLVARPEVGVPLLKPFSPRQLCFAAFMLQPSLRPEGGEPPFPRLNEPSTGLVDDSFFESNVDSGVHLRIPIDEQTPGSQAEMELLDDRSASWSGAMGSNEDSLHPGTTQSVDRVFIDDADILDFGEFDEMVTDLASAEAIVASDNDILAISDSEPIPQWVTVLTDIMPVLQREGRPEARVRLIAATLAAAGVLEHPHWRRPEVAGPAADQMEVLEQSRGFAGDMEWMGPLALLASLRRQQASGIIDFDTGMHHARLVFSGDLLLSLYLDARPPSRQLGQLLVSAGALDEAALLTALRDINAEPVRLPLGLALVRRGVISAEILQEALRAQVMGDLTDLFARSSGTFTFRHRPQDPLLHSPLALNMPLTRLCLDVLANQGAASRTPGTADTLLVPDISARRLLTPGTLTAPESDILDSLLIGLPADEVLERATHYASGHAAEIIGRLLAVGLIQALPAGGGGR